MTQNEFNLNLAQTLVESDDQFPIDFDDAWQWVGYSSKQKALQTLKNNFDKEVDFLTKGLKTSSGGRPSELILLSLECFKSFAMMAGTTKGKEVRKYFLECEKVAKDKLAQAVTKEVDAVEKIKLFNFAIDEIFSNTQIEAQLVAAIKLNYAKEELPVIAPSLEKHTRQLLINSTAKEPQLMTVTDIGLKMTPPKKATEVNQLLIQKGYQVKNTNKKSQKDLTYIPTDKAKDHCSITLATGTNNSTTYQQLRWYDSIIALI
jgi:phage anti-repressor protein